MALNALKIQTADLVGKLVAQLSNRPTNPIGAGGDNLTAQEVKERYDAYGHLLKERFNALVDALVADPAVDTDALANTIQVYLGDPAEEDPMSLSDALAALFATLATKYALPAGGIPATDLAEAVTTAINGKYVKPDTGIPATDLAEAVQTSLGKADTAYQKPSGGIPADDLASAVKAILESAVSQSEFAPVKALAENADKVLTAANYEAVATMLNAAAKTDYKVGQKILIGAGRVPDLWIYFVHDAAVTYTYTTALAFQTALENGTLQIGYYALRPLEAKTELEDYPTRTEMNSAISGNIDATLSTTGKSADAKAVGDAIDALIDALVDGVMAVAEATYAESATYAQQADIANQINTEREIEDADTACPPVVYGTVGGNAEVQNGKMKFTELRGNTIKWNQLMQNGNFVDNSGWGRNDATYSVSNNILTLTASAQRGLVHHACSQIAGHKYLLATTIKLTTATTDIRFCRGGSVLGGASVSTTDWQLMSYLYDGASTTASAYIGICDNRSSDWDAVQIKNFMLFDLTDIYGSGNEPSTVAEFVRDFPMPYYPYNAGTFLSSKSSSVDFVKRNQWDKSTEPITNDRRVSISNGGSYPSSGYSFSSLSVLPGETYCIVAPTNYDHYYACFDANGDYISGGGWTTTLQVPINCTTLKFDYKTSEVDNICIYINWNTPGLPFVPNSKQHITLPNLELRSAGSAYDVLYQQGGGKRRIGVVDLGTLNWGYSSGQGSIMEFISLGLTSVIKKPSTNDVVSNISCAKYEAKTAAQTYAGNIGIAIRTDGAIMCDNTTNYTDYTTFKAAMDGVMLYYELATETDITLEENPGWTEYAEIDNFGTVKFNQDPAQDIPVPQAYFVRYTVNLVEFLDSLYVHCGGDVSKILLDS